MGELLPTLAAESVRKGLLEYLETTFALADESAKLALADFLEDPTEGIFKGPYLRLRLPFQPAPDGWRDSLDWHPTDDGAGFPPYGHQAAAFARLSAGDLGPDKPRPLPTLVTTGTGSGKTEAFLYPILDHVLRSKARGEGGTKALLLYPMNALANDQAQRLADLITTHPALAGVTAGLFTGQTGTERTRVTSDGLITDRAVLRSSPPDLLLTNYKMLDQLLLRVTDSRIWEQSASSLQYVVLDEFHTYDGAQGTDVSMLLRRLGLALRAHGRPTESRLTPVATSATLGDKGDPSAMLEFAETVFGEPFPDDAVITETRLSVEEWIGGVDRFDFGQPRKGVDLVDTVNVAVDALGADPEAAALAAAVVANLYDRNARHADAAQLVQAHPLTRALLEACEEARGLGDLAAELLPGVDEERAVAFVRAYAAMLSHLRFTHGRSMPSVELHLWIRELTRIDREATAAPAYFWSDDGTAPLGAGETRGFGYAFPAIYCRHCGRAGWGITLSPANNSDLDLNDENIRRKHARNEGKFRALLLANREGQDSLAGQVSPPDNLRWFYAAQRQLLLKAPEGESAHDGSVLPVLTHVGDDADDQSRRDHCPACLQRDGIRFLGSAIATQLSVALSTIFGSTNLDQSEKKTLVFTDSVQDAAHRAGFVQSRSHSLTVRSILREAVGSAATTLDTLADRVIQTAGDDAELRFRLLPPDLADKEAFAPYWQEPRLAKVSRRVRDRVRKRIAFDAVLEFGLQSRLGRTLELTGTLAAHVDAPPAVLVGAARRAISEAGDQALLKVGGSERELVAWARGVLERMRERGAIEHPWLRRLIEEDGNRYFIWRGRPRSEGMPAFPTGRTAPAFPRIGSASTGRRENVLDPVATPQSWYALWTARSLQVSTGEATVLARLLLKQLASLDVLQVTTNKAGAEVYAIPQSSVLVEPIDDTALAGGQHLLVCTVCQSQVPGPRVVVDQLDGAPCLVSRCTGRLRTAAGDVDNFYRRFFTSKQVQRVIAREHTSLLKDDVRLAYENGFKGRSNDPQAPNVLVATPTLEMGIDIGDLSTVMLATLPRSVASYLQRVGRAGRLTGSSLNLAFVSGRGEQLPQLGEPASMINGRVRPPATYLDADEILRRQYVASLADREARSPSGVHPDRATAAIGSVDPGSYLFTLAREAETNGEHQEAFLAGFPSLSDDTRAALRAWVRPVDGATLTSPAAARLIAASQRWRQQVETLSHRIREIEAEIPELRRLAELEVATDDDKQAFSAAQGSLGLARRQRAELQGEYWIRVLEEAGIFPNYTLLDDSVTLDVGLSWLDPDMVTYETMALAYTRNAALALREFAPGATFYAGGHRVRVNAVDLGDNGDAVRQWVFCPACGFRADITENPGPGTCPRCGSNGISDVRQRLDVVELARASSTMRRDEAMIDDASDERVRESFDTVVTADFEPDDIAHQWYLDGFGFGVKHVRNLSLMWLNLGRTAGHGASRFISGQELDAELFRVCSACGQLDMVTGSNNKYEHRPWCRLRTAPEEDTRSIALSRSLNTEGLVVRLPPMISVGSVFAVPSLAAAIKLGLREHIGGAPDHLSVEMVPDPDPDGANHDALLLHDLVPGGTGYLADLADPQTLRGILMLAYEAVRDCDCARTERIACHKCLLPFAGYGQTRLVSRVEALRHLGEILTAGSGGEPDPEAVWTFTDQPTATFDPESRMEQKFRAVLKERLKPLGASLREHPESDGVRLEITIGGGRRWSLDPQLLIGGCKPDFVLRCDDPAVPQLAIFCDGWRYHASLQHNRLADDADKRAVLRDQGYVVLALSWDDLEEPRSDPPWFRPEVVSAVMGQIDINLRPSQVDLLRGGPMDFLASWLQAPDPDGLREVGRAVPWLLAASSTLMGFSEQQRDLATMAVDVLDGQEWTSGIAHTWAWRVDHLAVVARVPLNSTATEVAVVLDDTEIDEAHKPAWQQWLHLSNLLGLRDTGTTLTVRTRALRSEVADSSVEVPTRRDVLDPSWRVLLDQSLDSEREFLLDLHDADLVRPVLGHEVDGIPLGPSWPSRKVVVDADLDDLERAELEAHGWTVVRMTLENVRAALRTGAQ